MTLDEMLQVPQALALLRMHADAHSHGFAGLISLYYYQGGLRGVKEYTERAVKLKKPDVV
jgi:hypothetical protein